MQIQMNWAIPKLGNSKVKQTDFISKLIEAKKMEEGSSAYYGKWNEHDVRQ
jgi:hypothetical protein